MKNNIACSLAVLGASCVWATSAAAAPSLYHVVEASSVNMADYGVRQANASGQTIENVWSNYHREAHAFFNDHGARTEIQGVGDGPQTIAVSLNDAGQAVGWSRTSDDIYDEGAYSGWIYQNGVTTDLGSLGSGRVFAYAINSKGQVVGASDVQLFNDNAFLYDAGQMYNLNSYLDAPSQSAWYLHEALGINDAGQIVGTGSFGDNNYAFFLATPVPEPSSYGLMFAGLGALAFTRRRTMKRAA